MEEQKEEYVTDAKSRPLVPFVKLACKVNEAITDIQEAAQLVRMSTSEDVSSRNVDGSRRRRRCANL